MSDAIDALKPELRCLPMRDRVELARFLIETLGPVDNETAWEGDLARRLAEIRSGCVVGKPADQVFAELRRRFPRSWPDQIRRLRPSRSP